MNVYQIYVKDEDVGPEWQAIAPLGFTNMEAADKCLAEINMALDYVNALDRAYDAQIDAAEDYADIPYKPVSDARERMRKRFGVFPYATMQFRISIIKAEDEWETENWP